MTEERSTARVGQIRAVLRAGDADVTEAPLFFQLRLFPAIDRADVRENALLHTGHEHDRELEALHRVHGDERRGGLGLLVLVDVRHERDLLEEARKLLVLGQPNVVLGKRAELLHVGPALLSLLGAVLQVRLITGKRDEFVDEPRQGELLSGGPEPRHDLAEGDERVLLAPRNRGDHLRFLERLTDAYLVLASDREQCGARLVAEAARRGVEHARESERVLRISDEPQVRKRVLHLAALVEGDAADDLVREPEGAEGVLDRARLRVRAVEHGDVARAVRLALALQALDLASHELGFV